MEGFLGRLIVATLLAPSPDNVRLARHLLSNKDFGVDRPVALWAEVRVLGIHLLFNLLIFRLWANGVFFYVVVGYGLVAQQEPVGIRALEIRVGPH